MEIKIHRNFVAALTRFETPKPKNENKSKFNGRIPHPSTCQSCRIIVDSRQKALREKNAMIRKMADIEERYSLLQSKYERLQGDYDTKVNELNETRLLGFIGEIKEREQNTEVDIETFLSTHLISADEWPVEKLLAYVNYFQKALDQVSIITQKARSRVQVKNDVLVGNTIAVTPKKVAEQKARLVQEQKDANRKGKYKTLFKAVQNMMKTMKCDESKAIMILKSTGVEIPEDF